MDEQVFNKCSVILFHSLDVSTISPHLVKHQLVTESDSEKLDNPYISDVDKIDYLIQILPRKGNCWLEKFIQCLEETSEGTGHCKIVKELKRAKQDNALVLEFDTIEEGSGQLEATCMGEDSDVVESFTTYTTCTYQYSAYQQEPLFLTPNLLEFHVLGSLSTLNSEKSEMVAEPEMVPVTNQPLTDDASKPIEPEVIQKVDQYEPPDILEETPVVEFPYGQAVDLDITLSDTKPYTVRELEVNEEDLSLDSYEKVEYTETYQGNMFEPIIYTLTDLKDNKHIPGSPFVMHFPTPVDPTKCRVTGLPTVQPQVNSAIRLAVDCTKAGSAKLTVSVESPSGSEEPSKPDVNETSQGQYSIEYTPTVVGVHKLHINWDDQPVLLSPVLLDVASQKFVIFPHGSPISMEIVAGGVKAKDVSAHAIYKPTKEKIKVTVKKGGNKETFKLSFKPKHPGIYYVHVFVRHEETSNSPFKVKYSKPFDPSAVKVTVSESGPYFVEEPVKFVVDCTEAGVGELSIRSSGPSSGERQASFNVLDNKDGTYGAVYVPTAPGEHVFDILWSGKAIKDTPLRLHVLDGDVKLVEILGHSLEFNAALCLGFDTTEAGKGNLEAKCVGDNSGQIPCTVEKNHNKLNICFIPPQADIYYINVKWSSGGHIPSSPFKIKLLPPLSETIELENPTAFKSDMPLGLDFGTSTADDNGLDPVCINEVPVEVTPARDDKYEILFTSPEPDWGEEHVKDAPLKFNMLQLATDKVKLVSSTSVSNESSDISSGKQNVEASFLGEKSELVDCVMQQHVDDENISFVPQYISEEVEVIENEPIQAAVEFLSDLNDESENRNYSRATMTVSAENCSGVNCSDAKETIKSNYNNLTNLSIDSILGELYAKKVITSTEKEMIETSRLRKDKMAYFLDHVIIPSLNSNFIVKFQRFLEVMNDSDDLMFNNMANQLGFTPPAALQTQDETDFGTVKEPKPKPELTKDELKESYTNCFSGNIKEKKKGDITDLKDPKYKVLIQTVYDYEFYAAMMQLKGYKATRYICYDSVCQSSSYYYVGEWGEVPVVIVQIAMSRNGPHSSWYETKKALHFMRHLEYIFAVGVCGGVPAKVNLGNVVVSQIIFGYNDIKMTPTGWNHTVYALNTETDAYHQFTHADGIAQQQGIGIIVKPGDVLSGVWLIADAKLQKDLLNIAPQVIAFEMEGANIVQACGRGKAECLIVKGVSDLAGESKDDDWEPQAATNAAMYLNDEMNKAIHIFTTEPED